ncbi:MAG: beta-N-acetylhexosaminidase, partial [Tidjanibacter sp.]|nr:beta-N-acetylhexosaminidase [Tidjanibacter sp.]
IALVCALCSCSCGAAKVGVANFDNVIPQPQSVVYVADAEGYTLSGATTVAYGEGVDQRDAEFLVEYVALSTGINLPTPQSGVEEGGIVLTLDTTIANPEGYRLRVCSEGVQIVGASGDGLFYGIQTLRKALPVGKFRSVELPAVEVSDEPLFGYRGMHLDVSRHFDGVEFVKRYIDMLALHNMNTFHWHLTDDQGWRIEIKKYPLLTSVATTRSQTVIGRNSGVWDGVPYGEGCFYTQEQIREVVAYAAERHINIIPEIDMPGHMVAALAAYPELGCTGGPYEVWTIWGVSKDLLCVGNDQTVQFAKDVLEEVVALFPYEYVHIGGDECPKVRWHECPKCQARIDALGLRNTKAKSPEEALQGWFMREMADFLGERGKTVIGWDEVLDGENLGENMVVMSWRGEAGGIKAAKRRVRSIMTPNNPLYFDYYQTRDITREPFAIGGDNPLVNVYAYNPVGKIPEEFREYILGVQANVWREYIKTADHVEHMVLPRAAALCEVQWMNPEQKNYEEFLTRLQPMIRLYDHLGYNYAPYVLDVEMNLAPVDGKRAFEVSLSTLDNAEVRYTTSGRK